MKLLSIIIPVYNSEKYLKKCLDSILESSYRNLEIICINDGSRDKSLEILEKYSKIDSRIILINKENEGPQIARNKGYKISKGEYITNIDSDDWIEKDTFEKAILMLEKDNLDCVLYDSYFWFSKSKKERINKVKNNSKISGEEAFIKSLDWSISGMGVFKKDILLNSINVLNLYNGDEVVTRKIFLNSRKIGISDGKYFYRMHLESLTKSPKNKVKSIEMILSNCLILKMINEKKIKGEKIEKFKFEIYKDFIRKIRILIENNSKMTYLEKEKYQKIILEGMEVIPEFTIKELIVYEKNIIKAIRLYLKNLFYIYKFLKINKIN